ncbi:hypothetical protein [Helicobacter acinonychis]|uniref:hypothetical protein n=1 Tax=Helicobacter acinonychis TaxID=212 RepID=UPI00349F96F5
MLGRKPTNKQKITLQSFLKDPTQYKYPLFLFNHHFIDSFRVASPFYFDCGQFFLENLQFFLTPRNMQSPYIFYESRFLVVPKRGTMIFWVCKIHERASWVGVTPLACA